MHIGISVREYDGGTAWDKVEMGQCPLAAPTQDVQVNWIYWQMHACRLYILALGKKLMMKRS